MRFEDNRDYLFSFYFQYPFSKVYSIQNSLFSDTHGGDRYSLWKLQDREKCIHTPQISRD